jgi:HPt (histidine-containing phosphotransfer) domain-containing protein
LAILALTANALRGEERRAHAAGMDEYLTKPLQLQPLKAAIFRWLKRSVPVAAGSLPAPLAPGAPAAAARAVPAAAAIAAPQKMVDLSVLHGLVGDDAEIVQEFLGDFHRSSARLAGELREAHGAGDTRRVAAIAHQLKSSSRAIGALALGDLCAEVENACKAGATADAVQAQVQRFAECHGAVMAELESLLAPAGSD